MPTVAGSNMKHRSNRKPRKVTLSTRKAVAAMLGNEPSKRNAGVAAWLAWHKERARLLRTLAEPDRDQEQVEVFSVIPWPGSELRLREPLSNWMPVKQADKDRQENELRALVKRVIREETKYALYHGWIQKKPCEVCGEMKVEAHHPDYNDPYTVKWLCFYHHHIEHGHKPKHRSITKNNWYTKFGEAAAQLDRASAF